MSCISWNCRGLGNQPTVRALKRLIRNKDPSFIFLMETKMSSSEIKKVIQDLDFDGFHIVDCDQSEGGRRGGICLMWKHVEDFQILSESAHHIDGMIVDRGEEWRLTGIYGWPEEHNKRRTWDLIKNLAASTTGRWLCFGDLNEILYHCEKLGGRPKNDNLISAFYEAIQDARLDDLGYNGYSFTWTNGQEGDNNIQERLDRFLGNIEWVESYPAYHIQHLPRFASDHCPIYIKWTTSGYNMAKRGRKRRKVFRFETMWLLDESCKSVVNNCWNQNGGPINASELQRKIQKCGEGLKSWEQSHFGNIGHQITTCEEKLQETCTSLVNDVSNIERRTLENKLGDLYQKQELMWHQRSRTNWIKEGDRNTNFFHKTATGRRNRNTIQKIKAANGSWVEEEVEIAKVFENYFKELFSASPSLDMGKALDALDQKTTREMNEILTQPWTKEEIVAALAQMHPTKAPGPDGMPAIFFQKFWPTVHNDIISVVLCVLNGSMSPASINHTYIVLIPKKKNSELVSDFRPISLCNTIYKLISKTIANRLKKILPSLICPTQSAFVPGRLITDNALAAFEIFHSMKHNLAKNKGAFAFKLDMSKAYDRVEWVFLQNVMLKLGICSSFVKLIMTCVSSVSFSILVNGTPGITFHPSRGLRQGDPLSPYLFLLCAESFSALIRQAVASGSIHGVRVCRQAPEISHLFFADDSIIFGRANHTEVDKTIDIIRAYERASGQRINFDKSAISFSKGVTNTKREELADRMGVEVVNKHDVYLGLPTAVGRSKSEIFRFIIDRVRKKLKGWKSKLLTMAGKSVLIKAIAQAIPSFIMSCFLIPQEVCQQIASLVGNFLWGQKDEERRIHWISWGRVCRPKSEGGLGFRDFQCFNEAMLAKQGWRLMNDEQSLLAGILKARYYPTKSFLEATKSYNPSYTWRSIVAGREILCRGLRWNIGNGESVKIWKDQWIPDQPNFRITSLNNGWPEDAPVSSLIDKDLYAWNISLVEEMFSPMEARMIRMIPIRQSYKPDRLIWHHTKDGIYRVKSGYKVAKVVKEEGNKFSSSSGTDRSFWNWLWKLDIPPKIQMFLWKCVHDILPTKINLIKRGVQVDPSCSRCGDTTENAEHALRDCPWSNFLWESCPLRFSFPPSQSRGSIGDWIQLLSRAEDQESQQFFATLLWTTWFVRNAHTFQKKSLDHMWSINKAQQILIEFRKAKEQMHIQRIRKHQEIWLPPETGLIKINTDASIVQGTGTGLGAVIRDHRGKVIKIQYRLLPTEYDVDIAEAMAYRDGLILAQSLGLKRIVAETDSMTVHNKIAERAVDLSYLGNILLDIFDLLPSFDYFKPSFIKRMGNKLAHNVARHAFSVRNFEPVVGDTPAEMMTIVLAEVPSF